MTKQKKPRKPRERTFGKYGYRLDVRVGDFSNIVLIGNDCFDAKEARKLGEWLINAADYLESRGEK
jgi:hypothetical protein